MPNEEDVAQPVAREPKRVSGAVILVGVMLVEGALIFTGMKLFGGAGAVPAAASDVAPAPAAAHESAHKGESAGGDLVEIVLAETDASNDCSGRLYRYHIQVTALVRTADAEALKKLVEERGGTIKDRINTVIRGADPKHLNEPGLETIRRQVQFELDKIFGNNSLILELLIPELLQYRASL